MLLELDGLTLEREGAEGARTILSDLRLTLDHGERLALVGGNGSGKSTLLRYLAEPGRIPGIRVGYLCQDPDEQLVATTVGGEVSLGSPGRDPEPILAEVGLEGLANVDPRLLSAGQKQRLQMALVLSLEPDLLLLDEPASLQDAHQAAWVLNKLETYPGTVILATQDEAEARWCGRVLALDRGRSVADGGLERISTHPAVAALWRPLQSCGCPPTSGDVVARLSGVECAFHRGGLTGIDLDVRAGDRVGLVGANGSGKSTLLAILAGLRPPDRGSVTVAGRPFYAAGRQDLDHGLVQLAPQFPEYLFVSDRIDHEIDLAGADREATLLGAGLQSASLPESPHALSGGQRRRLALAMCLRANRPLALLDEPTAALDAEGRQQVVDQIAGLDPSVALVTASHDPEFLRACRCRLLEVTPEGLRSLAGPDPSRLH